MSASALLEGMDPALPCYRLSSVSAPAWSCSVTAWEQRALHTENLHESPGHWAGSRQGQHTDSVLQTSSVGQNCKNQSQLYASKIINKQIKTQPVENRLILLKLFSQSIIHHSEVWKENLYSVRNVKMHFVLSSAKRKESDCESVEGNQSHQ